MSGPTHAPEEDGAGGAAQTPAVAPDDPRLLQIGFAKLQGPSIDYVIRKYDIMMGRGTKPGTIDLGLGDGKQLSRQHARIFFDFGSGDASRVGGCGRGIGSVRPGSWEGSGRAGPSVGRCGTALSPSLALARGRVTTRPTGEGSEGGRSSFPIPAPVST